MEKLDELGNSVSVTNNISSELFNINGLEYTKLVEIAAEEADAAVAEERSPVNTLMNLSTLFYNKLNTMYQLKDRIVTESDNTPKVTNNTTVYDFQSLLQNGLDAWNNNNVAFKDAYPKQMVEFAYFPHSIADDENLTLPTLVTNNNNLDFVFSKTAIDISVMLMEELLSLIHI